MTEEIKKEEVVDHTAEMKALTELVEKQGRDYASMMGRNNAAEAKAAELQTQLESLKTPESKPTPKKMATDSDEILKLQSELGAMQEVVKQQTERAERLKTSAKRQAIVKGLKAAGGDSELSELAADSILLTNGKNINAVDNDNGSYDVLSTDQVSGMPVPIGDFIKTYMQTDAGKRIVAPKKNPLVPGGKGVVPAGEKIEVDGIAFSALTPEQRSSGKYKLRTL